MKQLHHDHISSGLKLPSGRKSNDKAQKFNMTHSYPDFFIESERGAGQDEVSVIEAAGGQTQSQQTPLLSELHHAVFGHLHFTGWRKHTHTHTQSGNNKQNTAHVT